MHRLYAFVGVMLLIIAAFASTEYISYGYKDDTSYTWFYSFLYRIFSTTASNFDNKSEFHRVLGTFYSIFFSALVGLLFLNLIIAIMQTSYEAARAKAGDAYWAARQVLLLANPDFSLFCVS